MGSHTFQQTIGDINLTPPDAYDKLVEAAQWEHGHDVYNGTISTTQGLLMIKAEPDKVQEVIDSILETDHPTVAKWGAAGCIELTGSAMKNWERTHGFRGKHGVRAYVFFGWACS